MVDKLSPVISHAAAVGDVNTIKQILSGETWVYTAPAFGYACRFGGVESVRALIQGGARLFLSRDEKFEYQNYYDNARVADYVLMLLDSCSWRSRFENGWCLDFKKWYKAKTPDKRKILSKEERIEILELLLQNQKTIGFDPGLLLFYAILAEDSDFVSALRKHNITLSPVIYSSLFERKSSRYWRMICSIGCHKKMTLERLLSIMENICLESKGNPMRCTMCLIRRNTTLFYDVVLMERLLDCLNHKDLNKLVIMQCCIDRTAIAHFELFEKLGWLNRPLTRDKLIDYAGKRNNVEMTAWLLDFKNRTADLAAEQKKAERKMERELNSSPDSVYMLSKLWGYKKNDDNTLKVISYKGNAQDIYVPGKIGNRKVTAIDDYAFSAFRGKHLTRDIKSVVLPEGVEYLGRNTFFSMDKLESINLPSTLTDMGLMCFAKCSSLKSIHVPAGVTKIPPFAFEGCTNLSEVSLPQGLLFIEPCAFALCVELKELYIPQSVVRIAKNSVDSYTVLLVNRDSAAHQMCKNLKIDHRVID